MNKRPAKTILLIEDQLEEARLISDMLNSAGAYVFELAHVQSVNKAEKLLAEHSIDIVLMDLGLADSQGLAAVRRVRLVAPRVSIVLLSSPDDEAIAIQAMQEGAQDYLVKSQIEPRELIRALLNAVERKTIEEVQFTEKERAQVTLDSIGDAIICTDLAGNITFLNPVAERMTGWPSNEASGQPMTKTFQMIDAGTRNILRPMAKATAQNRKGELPQNCILIRRDGHELFIEDSVAPIHDRGGHVTGAVIVFRDVTATRQLEEKLTHSAEHDSLTGLPNRTLLNDRLGQAIALARRRRGKAAVLFLDLDGFKKVNDSLGHLVGDQVLQSVAKRLQCCVRGPDTVSRRGGDEFVVLLQELQHPDDASKTARRLLKAVADVYSIDGHDIHITTTIGVSVYPQDGEEPETLIKSADTAMYHAKKDGKSCFEFFKPQMKVENEERQLIELDLWLALEKGEFGLHYQPKVDLRTGTIVGADALIRWKHPTRGMVPPAVFIPVAEESGLMLPIGAWILHEACTQAKAWADAGEPKTVAVNISWMQLQREDFPESLFQILQTTGLNPELLELDVTENILTNHAVRIAPLLAKLRDRGVKVSADNFGIGSSSLGSLQKLPLHALKIDRSFVHLTNGRVDRPARVNSIVEMGKTLKVRVVAEGIETSEDLSFLSEHRCDEALGYYFGQPVPAPQFGGMFRSQGFQTAIEFIERGGRLSN